MHFYIDTSAAAKFVLDEVESDALFGWLRAGQHTFVSSALTKVELLRFARRYGLDAVERSVGFLRRCDLSPLADDLLDSASHIGPDALRSLDAIHLATALELRSQISGVVTYDHRLAEACALHGLEVVAPA